jgi:hypothetical protein
MFWRKPASGHRNLQRNDRHYDRLGGLHAAGQHHGLRVEHKRSSTECAASVSGRIGCQEGG